MTRWDPRAEDSACEVRARSDLFGRHHSLVPLGAVIVGGES